MIYEHPPNAENIAQVRQWAVQTLMFAINLANVGDPQPADPVTYFDGMEQEAIAVSRKLFDDMRAECDNVETNEALLNFIGKVFSWCSERRHGVS